MVTKALLVCCYYRVFWVVTKVILECCKEVARVFYGSSLRLCKWEIALIGNRYNVVRQLLRCSGWLLWYLRCCQSAVTR